MLVSRIKRITWRNSKLLFSGLIKFSDHSSLKSKKEKKKRLMFTRVCAFEVK